MNSRVAAIILSLLLLLNSAWGADPFTNYVDWRYHPPHMQIKDIEGLQQRIRDGKLHLRLHDFLELALKNSTDIQLTRLDVYTSANDIVASKVPFDPVLKLGFDTQRSVSPFSFFTFGGGGSGVVTSPTTPGQTGGGGGGSDGGSSGTAGNQVILPQTISSLAQNSNAAFAELLPPGRQCRQLFRRIEVPATPIYTRLYSDH
jgi:hypothetical protein